jgi:hypothetical protein
MAFPHPKSGKDKSRNGDKPNHGGIVWQFLKRTVNIARDRNAQDEVNQARNPTFGGNTHHSILSFDVIGIPLASGNETRAKPQARC